MDKAAFLEAKRFIYTDISREIALARCATDRTVCEMLASNDVPVGGGNFLAALGLLCYTEFAGKLKYHCTRYNSRTKQKEDCAAENFNRFFDDMGPCYKAFRSTTDVYRIFRCGLAHEYFVKANCTIAMLGTQYPCGIRQLPDGRYEFGVERYFLDFKSAFDCLEQILFPG